MGSYDPQGNIERGERDLGGAISSQIGPLADQVREKASNVADRASSAISDAKDRGTEAADNAGEVIGALRDAVTHAARTQPGTTVLLSIAAGFLLGAMWKSGR